jgi:hypothetical protein
MKSLASVENTSLNGYFSFQRFRLHSGAQSHRAHACIQQGQRDSGWVWEHVSVDCV